MVNPTTPAHGVGPGAVMTLSDWLAHCEQIGFEKAGIMRTGRPVIVADPKPPQSVLDYAAAIKAATPTDRIVVFGSFYTVGGVLQDAREWTRA